MTMQLIINPCNCNNCILTFVVHVGSQFFFHSTVNYPGHRSWSSSSKTLLHYFIFKPYSLRLTDSYSLKKAKTSYVSTSAHDDIVKQSICIAQRTLFWHTNSLVQNISSAIADVNASLS